MVDAAMLAYPDGMGGTFWRPARLDDIHDVPFRTLHLFHAYRAGLGARSDPWRWWVTGKGNSRIQHQFRVSFEGYPDAPARCGVPQVDGMTHDEKPTKCSACERLAEGKPASFGTIGD